MFLKIILEVLKNLKKNFGKFFEKFAKSGPANSLTANRGCRGPQTVQKSNNRGF